MPQPVSASWEWWLVVGGWWLVVGCGKFRIEARQPDRASAQFAGDLQQGFPKVRAERAVHPKLERADAVNRAVQDRTGNTGHAGHHQSIARFAKVVSTRLQE